MKVGHKNFSTPRSIEKIDQVDATKSDSAESRLPSVSAIFTIFGTASFQALNDHVKMPVPQQFLPITQGPTSQDPVFRPSVGSKSCPTRFGQMIEISRGLASRKSTFLAGRAIFWNEN